MLYAECGYCVDIPDMEVALDSYELVEVAEFHESMPVDMANIQLMCLLQATLRYHHHYYLFIIYLLTLSSLARHDSLATYSRYRNCFSLIQQCCVLQACKFPGRSAFDGRTMECKMPVVELPQDFVSKLNASESGILSQNTVASGVAAYVAENGNRRADIYLDIRMDGIEVQSPKEIDFALAPDVSCGYDDVYSYAAGNSVVAIKVRNRRC